MLYPLFISLPSVAGRLGCMLTVDYALVVVHDHGSASTMLTIKAESRRNSGARRNCAAANSPPRTFIDALLHGLENAALADILGWVTHIASHDCRSGRRHNAIVDGLCGCNVGGRNYDIAGWLNLSIV